MAASVLDGELTFFSESKGDKITFVANKREIVKIGSDLVCDVRIVGADDVHMTIEMDSTGKVRATNLSANDPILINGEIVADKRIIKSGDVIAIKSHSLRWDLKSELRRRTAALTKSARKEAKHRVIRTTKRLTIHNLLTERQAPVEIPAESINEEEDEMVVEETPPPKEKENLSKLSSLNLSGTLITSFTPRKTTTRSSSVVGTASPKNILNESSNLNRSMHLVDLTGTPLVKRNKTPGNSAAKRTPLSAKKTPIVQTRNETLLKSAIKNSSIKKRINDKPQTPATSKGKSLFQSPIMDTSEASSSVMSVSFASSNQTGNESVIRVEETQTAETKSVSEFSNRSQDGSLSDEETQKLLDNISIVLDDNETSRTPPKKSPLLIESERTPEIEKNFEEILKETTLLPSDQIDKAFGLIAVTPGQEKHGGGNDPQKKAESLLNWIETARESLASNNTEQVLSSRYSNVTPNDSVVTTIAYDTTTPKISILDTVQDSIRKSEGLAMSPVARLSINDNSTVVVENFQLNNNIQKSLRSTRKRIGKAMSSLHDISQNQNSTFDETLNFSTLISNNEVNEQSALETTSNNLLSLDEPQQAPTSTSIAEIERDENAENIPPSMQSNNYIEFAEHNENDETEREFFEISNSEVAEDDLQEVQDSSSSSEESESEAESLSDIEEIIGSSQEPEAVKQSPNNAAVKFRLSEQDLEEDGINPLDISSRSNNEEIEIPCTEADEQVETNENAENSTIKEIDDSHIELPATQQIDDFLLESDEIPIVRHNNEISEHVEPIMEQLNEISEQIDEVPATEEISEEIDEVPASEEISSQQMNELINNSGSVGMLDAQTEDIESMIEEHLEASREISRANVSEAQTVDVSMNEEHLEASNIEIQTAQQQTEGTIDIPIEDQNVITVESQQIIPSREVQETVYEVQSSETITQQETTQNDDDDEMIPSSQEYIYADAEQVDSDSTLKEVSSSDSIYDEKVESLSPAKSNNQQQLVESDSNVKENLSVETISDDTNDANNADQQEVQEISLISDDEIEQEQALPVADNPVVEEEPQENVKSTDPNESIELFETQAEDFIIPTVSNEIEEPGETLKLNEVQQEQSPEKSPASPEKLGQQVLEEVDISSHSEVPMENVLPKMPSEELDETSTEAAEESPKNSAILEMIEDESISLKISVTVEESPKHVEAGILPETIEEEPEENTEDISAANIGDEIDSPEDIPEKTQSDELPSDSSSEPLPIPNIEETIEGDEDMEQQEHVVEEICIKKFAYVTTDLNEKVQAEQTVAETSQEFPEKRTEEPIMEQESTETAEPLKLPEAEFIESSEVVESLPVVSQKQEEVMPSKTETQIVESLEVHAETLALPTPRRRARVNYADLAAGSPAKTPSRRGRSASTETAESSVKVTPKPPRSARKIMATIEEKSSNENDSQRKVELKVEPEVQAPKEKTPEKEKTVKKRGAKAHLEVPSQSPRRGRSASVDQRPVETETKQVSPAKSEIVESTSKRTASRRRVVSESVDTEKQQPPKKRARARNMAAESTEETEKLSVEVNEVAVSRGRRAAKEAHEEKIEEPQNDEIPVKKGHARKKDESSEKSEEPIVDENKKGRGRRGAKETLPVENAEEIKKDPTPVKKGRGRKKAEEEADEKSEVSSSVDETKQGRGRHATKDTDVEEKKQSPQKEAAPAKKGRGRKKNESTEKSDEPKVEEKAHSPEKEVAPVKKGRGRKKAEESAPEATSAEEKPEEVKKGRGRKKVEEKLTPAEVKLKPVSPPKSPEVVVEEKPKRGRKAQVKVDETEKPETSSKRGNTARNKTPEPEPKPSTSKRVKATKTVEEPVKKERGRRKAVEASPQTEEKVESPKAKPTRRGKTAEVQKSEEPVTSKRRRAEKVAEVIELSSQEDTPKRAKTDDDNSKKRKQVSFKTPSKEKAPAKTTSRKRQAQPEPATTSEEPVAKRSTRMKKK